MTKLISGEASCLWSLWFRARNVSDKVESSPDLDGILKAHSELAQWRGSKLREEGVVVWPERGITVNGRAATISGKPDITYLRDGVMHFEDCKTGKRRDSDHIQVLLYMWLFSIQNKNQFRGSVVYKDEIVAVDLTRLDVVRARTLDLVAMAASDTPPLKTPSPAECRMCNIPAFYCEDRQHFPGGDVYTTEEF